MPKKRKKTVYYGHHQRDIELFDNQQALCIHKPDYISEGLPCLIVGMDEMFEAKRIMKDCEFSLYLYCAANKNGYIKAMSPQDFCKKTGVSRQSYYNARDGLIEMGYINLHKKGEDGKGELLYDTIDFYTHPSRNPEWNKAD